GSNAHVSERLVLDELFADRLQDGHLLIGPFDFALTLLRQGKVLHIECQPMRCRHVLPPRGFADYFAEYVSDVLRTRRYGGPRQYGRARRFCAASMVHWAV